MVPSLGSPKPPLDTGPFDGRVRALAATVGIILVGASGLNFCVNPYGYYPPHWVAPITWSSRLEKTQRMQRYAAVDVLILGSSRSMSLRPAVIADITGARAFNASVDSARIEDYWAFYRYAVEACHWQPTRLFIGVDIEAFHNRIPPDVRLLTTPGLQPFLPFGMRASGLLEAARALPSYEQLRASIKSLWYSGAARANPGYEFEADGSIYYREFEKEIQSGRFRPDYATSLKEYDQRFATFTALDEERRATFEKLVDDARNRRIAVTVFISPLSRVVRAHLERTSRFSTLRVALTEYLRDLRGRSRLQSFYDFTDVATFGGDPDLFYDGAHVRPENADRLLETLIAGTDAVQ